MIKKVDAINAAMGAICLALVGCAPSMKANEKGLAIKFATIETSTSIPFRPDSSMSFAVIPFIDAVNAQNSGTIVAQIVGDELSKAGFTTVDRSSLREIMTERALVQSGVLSDLELKEIGSKLGARYILHGMVKKYATTELETKGNSVTTIVPTQYGGIAFTKNAESSKREEYTTKFLMKIIDISSGTAIFRADFDIQKSQIDNEQSVAMAIKQMLIGEYYRAKSDSISNSKFRSQQTADINNHQAIHSLLEESILIDSVSNETKYAISKKIAYSMCFLRVDKGDIYLSRLIENNAFLYCDSANLNMIAAKATKSLFEEGDSLGVINMIELASSYLSKENQEKVFGVVRENAISFSITHRDYLSLHNGIKFNTITGKRCFDNAKPCRPKEITQKRETHEISNPAQHNNAKYR